MSAAAKAPITLDDFSRFHLEKYNEDAIVYSASNPASTKITRDNLIDHIACRLTGNLVVGTSAATLTAFGAMQLIRKLNLTRNSKDVIFNVPGYALQEISREQFDQPPLRTDPAVTVGTNAFEYEFVLQCETGDSVSPLDASQANSLNLEVQWGAATDMATAGGGGGTIALTNVTIEVTTVVAVGGIPGQFRGVQYGKYLTHRIDHEVYDIAAAGTDKVIADLPKDVILKRLTCFTIIDNVPVNTIVNSLTTFFNGSNLQRPRARHIQCENYRRYKMSAIQTGEYIIDYARKGQGHDMLLFRGSPRFQLIGDINKPGGTVVQIITVKDRFEPPSA